MKEMPPAPQSEKSIFSEKAKIILPIAGSVAALLVFMILVWPTAKHGGKHGKQSHARNDRVAEAARPTDDSRGAGWRSDESEHRSARNRPATGNGAGPGSPRQEASSHSAGSKGDTWWYHQDGTVDHSAEKGGWWYH